MRIYLQTTEQYLSGGLQEFYRTRGGAFLGSDLNYEGIIIPYIDQSYVSPGDIVQRNHPMNGCDWGFTGFFNNDGKLKYAYFTGYGNYEYFKNKIFVKPVELYSCDMIYCLAKTEFTINGKTY